MSVLFGLRFDQERFMLTFTADEVVADITEYTQECVVYLIGFGTGNPESGGHGWCFSRSFDDDWGVCTVREVQQATVYEGIASFELSRTGMKCVFEPAVTGKIGCTELRVTFVLDDALWQQVTETAQVIFQDRMYFTLSE